MEGWSYRHHDPFTRLQSHERRHVPALSPTRQARLNLEAGLLAATACDVHVRHPVHDPAARTGVLLLDD
eukprot:7376623-Prymnesium_polylepis.1